ncbi:HD-GYP domain-containing protein [Paenibacillus cremeus]|uniref:HD domain-containing protein n=1 Tax=Paenibacillus cremeus TaxID=2163881 RepID=A0A559K7F8_9BACL|nr:HD domain-containing phosphohydrolase [Paenibacillus cremeus]TVY08066.1 HD domain-containing protein [Paenibacillus cremeus]
MSLVYMKRSYPGIENVVEADKEDMCLFLMRKLWSHHRETYFHSVRVSALCAKLFDLYGISREKQETLLRSALLHDIGKLQIDKALLDKRGLLSKEEWNMLKGHCRNGTGILKAERLKDFVDMEIILYHHENLDGSGYYGLKQGNLSLGVKIIRVADSYDAMIHPRVYSRAKSADEIFDELQRLSGVHYDGDVVDALYQLNRLVKKLESQEATS